MTRGRDGKAPNQWGPWHPYKLADNPQAEALRASYAPGAEVPQVIWKNGLLAVIVEQEYTRDSVPMLHLSYRREDRKPIRDWRHAQRMKSELCGADAEGVELYPSEARLVDGANQYHLYVLPPGLGFNFGFDTDRAVADEGEHTAAGIDLGPGRQRAFDQSGKDAALFAPGLLPRHFPAWANHVRTLKKKTRLNPKAAPAAPKEPT